jgi:hypothetical protein
MARHTSGDRRGAIVRMYQPYYRVLSPYTLIDPVERRAAAHRVRVKRARRRLTLLQHEAAVIQRPHLRRARKSRENPHQLLLPLVWREP